MQNRSNPTGGLTILRGSLAPDGAVVKERRFRLAVFTGGPGPLIEAEGALDAVGNGTVVAGDVVVIRYEGPRGGAGHAGDARGHRDDQGRRGWAKEVLLITDAGSPRHHRLCIGHIAPEATDGGPIAVDPGRRLDHPGHEQPRAEPGRARPTSWSAAAPTGDRCRRSSGGGVLGKYAKLVSSAAQGAVCWVSASSSRRGARLCPRRTQ